MMFFKILTFGKNIEVKKRISCVNWSSVWTLFYNGFGNFDKN